MQAIGVDRDLGVVTQPNNVHRTIAPCVVEDALGPQHGSDRTDVRGHAPRDRWAVRIAQATHADIAGFLQLAAEVEPWFGPMVNEPGFHEALRRNIDRESALVARDGSGAVVGGLLFSYHRPPTYAIGWLVVASHSRSRGIGRLLVEDALRRWVRPPCVVEAVGFGEDHPGARLRRFYEDLGFHPAEPAEAGPEGGSRQVFRLHVGDALPDWVR